MTTEEKWLTKGMRAKFQRVKLRSFEACRIADVPDLYAIDSETGYNFWIEAKAMPNENSPIPYSGGQRKWIKELEADGGIGFVICLLTSTGHIAIFRDEILLDRIDATNPLWASDLERILTQSLE